MERATAKGSSMSKHNQDRDRIIVIKAATYIRDFEGKSGGLLRQY